MTKRRILPLLTTLFGMPMLSVLFFSCSDDTSSDSQQNPPISFRTELPGDWNELTRTAMPEEFSRYHVSAIYKHDGKNTKYINNETILLTNQKSATKYWPIEGAMDFIAYSVPEGRTFTANIQPAGNEFTKLPSSFTQLVLKFSTPFDGKTDILYTNVQEENCASHHTTVSPVALNFKHAMSKLWLKITAQTQETVDALQINEAYIDGIAITSSQLTIDCTTSPNTVSWQPLNKTLINCLDFGGMDPLSISTPAMIGKDGFLIIPGTYKDVMVTLCYDLEEKKGMRMDYFFDKLTFEAGKQYVFNYNVELNVIEISSSMELADWNVENIPLP